DFDALGGALACRRPRAPPFARRFFGWVFNCGLGGFASVRAAATFAERQPRLGIVFTGPSVARAVLFEAARDFAAPFGLGVVV
ncbi:MAG: hypothetical protein WA434_07695, partial [Candidatus Acidiferrales bacterium]